MWIVTPPTDAGPSLRGRQFHAHLAARGSDIQFRQAHLVGIFEAVESLEVVAGHGFSDEHAAGCDVLEAQREFALVRQVTIQREHRYLFPGGVVRGHHIHEGHMPVARVAAADSRCADG